MKILAHFVWLVPGWLLFLAWSQITVLSGLQNTFQNGTNLIAQVEDFRIKHIASQTNGYIVLRINPQDAEPFSRKLSLPVQVAAKLQDQAAIAIRYLPGSTQEIVMLRTYPFHRNMVTVNISVLIVSILITFLLALATVKFIYTREKDPDFERIDQGEQI